MSELTTRGVVIDADERYGLRMALLDFLASENHNQPCQCVACDAARGVADRLAPLREGGDDRG